MQIGNWPLLATSFSVWSRNDKRKTMKILLDVKNVKAVSDYQLHLEFENGEKRIFDMAPYMEKRPFIRLKGSPLFAMAKVEYGTVVWPGNIDIASETLYDKSKPC